MRIQYSRHGATHHETSGTRISPAAECVLCWAQITIAWLTLACGWNSTGRAQVGVGFRQAVGGVYVDARGVVNNVERDGFKKLRELKLQQMQSGRRRPRPAGRVAQGFAPPDAGRDRRGERRRKRTFPTKFVTWRASSGFNTSSFIPRRTTSCWPALVKAGRSTIAATWSARRRAGLCWISTICWSPCGPPNRRRRAESPARSIRRKRASSASRRT